ncbi:biotin attachment protein [Lachnoclostridium sp. An131]|nr:biotin attachment protein [Lachnoclostridium sp. An131]
MRKEVIMPKVGLDMEEGIIQEWLKKVGDHITAGEPLMSIETDKAITEIEAAVTGTLVEIVVPEGEEVEIATVVAYIDTDEE